MPLRKYQREAIQAIRENRDAGVTRQLVVLPTGVGKTQVAASLPEFLKTQQLWFLVHRLELIDQAFKHYQRLNPDLKVGIERERFHADRDCDIVIGSIPTLVGREVDTSQVDVVVLDESHHSISQSYRSVLNQFGVLKGGTREDKSRLLCGLTATPSRSDNIGLELVFDKIVYSKDIREMINDGWLVPIHAYRVDTTVDITDVGTRRGDFITSQLERAVNTPARNRLIVEKYKELGGGKPGIAFTVDVRHSHDLALCFREAGIGSMPFSGKTPEDERKRLLEQYGSGEIKILTSCSALNEGVDIIQAEIGLLARPTTSGLLLRQMCGRLLRPYPAPEEGPSLKKQATIIDFVDNTARNHLVTLPTLFGLPHKLRLQGESITAVAEEAEQVEKRTNRPLPDFSSMAELRSMHYIVDLMKAPVIPSEIEQISRFAWLQQGSNYELVLPEYLLSIHGDGIGHFRVYRRSRGIALPLGEFDALYKAFDYAECAVPTQERVLVSRSVRWRSMPVSEKQARVLMRIQRDIASRFPDFSSFHEFIKSQYTRGDASQIIDRANLEQQRKVTSV